MESPLKKCDDHLESVTEEEVSRATKAAHDKKKMMKEPNPPPLDMLPHTLTLHPMKFKDGAIEYKIKWKGKSTPFSSAKTSSLHNSKMIQSSFKSFSLKSSPSLLKVGKILLFTSQLEGKSS